MLDNWHGFRVQQRPDALLVFLPGAGPYDPPIGRFGPPSSDGVRHYSIQVTHSWTVQGATQDPVSVLEVIASAIDAMARQSSSHLHSLASVALQVTDS